MTLLLAHSAVTLALVGLIWTIQVVHYPLMRLVGTGTWTRYHREHTLAITRVVAPLMFVELGSALAIVALRPAGIPATAAWAGAALTLGVWALTFFVSVPLHARLEHDPDRATLARLVTTNWIRTLVWTARGILVLAFVAWHTAALVPA